jgi:predicted dehydrogenase
MLGGVRNLFEAYTPAAAVRCSMSQVPEVLAYAPGERVFGDEYLAEKVQTTAGWNLVAGDEFWSRGYVQEMQDFIECVIQGREPLSGPRLGRDVVEVVYSSYLSAATGSRVDLPDVAAA